MGDDAETADVLTHAAFTQFLKGREYAGTDIATEDIRLAMVAIASGRTLEELRWRIGPALFAILQANAERVRSDNAAEALSEYFEIDQMEFEAEEFGPAVGASLVHFPKKFGTRSPYTPLSSHSFR
jgi:hypothetical protein